VTRTELLPDSANTPPVNPRLRELLEKDQLDWDDPRHREAYLRAWVKGAVPKFYLEDAHE
jgi:hypothetical protein